MRRRSKAQTRRKSIKRAQKKLDIAERRARGETVPKTVVHHWTGGAVQAWEQSLWASALPKTPEMIEEEERLKLREQLMREQG